MINVSFSNTFLNIESPPKEFVGVNNIIDSLLHAKAVYLHNIKISPD